jgi:hypothetical protein
MSIGPGLRAAGPAFRAIVLLPLAALAACGDEGSPSPGEVEVVASVELDRDTLTLRVGQQAALHATVRNERGQVLSSAGVTWAALDPDTATVSPGGVVAALVPGRARIVATTDGRSDTADVRVRHSDDLPTELAGSYRPVRFHLAAGETYTATADVVIRTDELLRIDGELLYEPGVSVVLHSADSLVVTGSVGPVEPEGSPALVLAADAGATDPCGRALPGDLLISAREVELTGDGAGGGGLGGLRSAGNLWVASAGSNGQLTISYKVLTSGEGYEGCKGHDGGLGYSIEIGTGAANILVAERLGSPHAPFDAIGLFSAGIYAGWGGRGWSNQGETEKEGSTRVAEATNGGPGGDLRITSARLLRFGADVGAGRGGGGGHVAAAAISGGGVDGAGEDLRARSGSGGASGSILVVAPQLELESPRFEAGDLGWPGALFVTGGHGSSGKPGGRFDLTIGRFGPPGRLVLNGEEQALTPTHFEVSVEVLNALNGGRAVEQVDGGDGGQLEMRFEDASPRAADYRIIVRNAGNGGAGFNGCEAGGTYGTNGGHGGRLDIPLPVRPIVLEGRNFSGGDGGDGNGFGTGGFRGRDVTIASPFGEQGEDGARCPATVPALELAYALSDDFPAGAVIALDRIQGLHTAQPEEGCASEHVHALASEGITIDGMGPFPDPDPFGCGYGVVVASQPM